MTLRDKTPERERYSVFATVVVIAAVVLGATVSSGVVAAQSAQSETDEYAVVQGDNCFTIDSFGDGSQSVEEFYDYRTPDTDPSAYTYSSFGTTHLQADDTSRLFLYEGSDGVSLVLLHGQFEGDSPGGAVTMQFDGLPEDGEWVIEDDDYDGRDDEFNHQDTSSRITWVYTESRNDGAAFRGGLADDFDITIEPSFNDAADFRVYDGQITDWQALSATDGGFEQTSLDMSEPIDIQSGGCTSYAVTDLETDGSMTAGDSFDVTATVENDGELPVTANIPFTLDGETVDEREVALETGETATVSTTVTIDETGTYTVGAANETTTVTIDESDDGIPGFGIITVALAAMLVALIVRYRR